MKKRFNVRNLSYIVPATVLSTSLVTCVLVGGGDNNDTNVDPNTTNAAQNATTTSGAAISASPLALDNNSISAGVVYSGQTYYSARLATVKGDADGYFNSTVTSDKMGDTISFSNGEATTASSSTDAYHLPHTSGQTANINDLKMLDFNNDSGSAINLTIPGFYTADNVNTLGNVTTVDINDHYHGDSREYTSPLEQIGFYAFSGNARIYNATNNTHSYYEPVPGTFNPADGATMWNSLTSVNVASEQGNDKPIIALKVVHAGAFSNNTAISTIDLGRDNQITYLDELYGPSDQQTADYTAHPNEVPRPIYYGDGGDFAGDPYYGTNPGIFENTKSLTNIDLHQAHYGEYTLKSYLKNIPARAFKDAVRLTSLNGNSDGFYLPNSVQTIGELAFDNTGTGSRLANFYFPDPDIENGDTGVQKCANNIFGDLSNLPDGYLTDIYFPELNPSDNLVNGLFRSLSTLNPNHPITFHLPFNIADTAAYSGGKWDASKTTVGKKLINGISTRKAVYIAPTTYAFTNPNFATSYPFGGVNTTPQYFNTNFDPKSSDNTKNWSNKDNYWTVSTIPRNAYATGADINNSVTISTNYGANLNFGDSTTKFDEMNKDGTATSKYELDSVTKHYVWKFAPQFTVTQSIGSNVTSPVNITFKSNAYPSAYGTSNDDNITFWNVEADKITYSDGKTGSHAPIVQNILYTGDTPPTPSYSLITTVAPKVSLPTGKNILDEVGVNLKVTSYKQNASSTESSPPSGWDKSIGIATALVSGKNDQFTITPKFTKPTSALVQGIYNIQYEIYIIQNGIVIQTSDTIELDVWGVTAMNINYSGYTYLQNFDSAQPTWSASHTYAAPTTTFVYGNNYQPTGTGTGYPTEKVTFADLVPANFTDSGGASDLANWTAAGVVSLNHTTNEIKIARNNISTSGTAADYKGTLTIPVKITANDNPALTSGDDAVCTYSWEKYGDVYITPTADAGAFSVDGASVSVYPIAIGNHTTTTNFGTLTLTAQGFASGFQANDHWDITFKDGDTNFNKHITISDTSQTTITLALNSDDWSDVQAGTYRISVDVVRAQPQKTYVLPDITFQVFGIDASIDTANFTNPSSFYQDATYSIPTPNLGSVGVAHPITVPIDPSYIKYTWTTLASGGTSPASFLTLATPDVNTSAVTVNNDAYSKIGTNLSFEFQLTITIQSSGANPKTINDGISNTQKTMNGYALNIWTKDQALSFTTKPSAKYYSVASAGGNITGSFSYNDNWANPSFGSNIPPYVNIKYKLFNFWKSNGVSAFAQCNDQAGMFNIDANTGYVKWNKTSLVGIYKFDVALEITLIPQTASNDDPVIITWTSTNSAGYNPENNPSTWISADGCYFTVDLSDGNDKFDAVYHEHDQAPISKLAVNDSIGSPLVTIPANSTFDPKTPTNPFLTIDVYIPYIAGFTDVDWDNWVMSFTPTSFSPTFDSTQVLCKETRYVKPHTAPDGTGRDGSIRIGIWYDFSTYSAGQLDNEFTYNLTLGVKDDSGNVTYMYTSNNIRQFVLRPTSFSGVFNYNGKVLNNGDKIKIEDTHEHDISVNYTLESDSDFFQISPTDDCWKQFIRQLDLTKDVQYNGKLIDLPVGMNIDLNTNPNDINFGAIYIQINENIFSKEYYGLYTVNVGFNWFDVGTTAQPGDPVNLKFGFVLDLEKPKPNNTGVIVGIVAAAVVGVAMVGISGKLIANKARARKILAEEREDEKEDKGSSKKELAPKSSKSGF